MRRFAGIAAVLFLLLLPLAACGGAEEKAGFDPEDHPPGAGGRWSLL